MTCSIPCEYESNEFCGPSNGIIKKDEQVCRFGYTMHFDSKGRVSSSVIRKDDLKIGELSLWRLPISHSELELKQLVKIGEELGGDEQQLIAIFARKAIDVQQIIDKNSERMFCIIDNPIIDNEKNTAPNHCVLRVCKVHFGSDGNIADELVKVLRTFLFHFFRENRIYDCKFT